MVSENRNTFRIKAVLIIVALVAAAVYFTGMTTFASVDYEAEYFSEDMLGELDAHKALVATQQQYESYEAEFEDYVLGGGDLLVIEGEGNVIGSRYFATDGEINCVPVMAIAEDDRAVPENAYDYRSILDEAVAMPMTRSSGEITMFLSVAFFVYANDNTQVATAGIYNYVDYYETRYAGVSYYNVFAEVYVAPKSSNYKVNSFKVDISALTEGSLEVRNRTNNSYSSSGATVVTHSMGTGAASELPDGVSSTVTYASNFSYPLYSVDVTGGSPVYVDDDGDSETDQIVSTYSVVPHGITVYGSVYSAMFMHTLRTSDYVNAGCMIRLYDLSMTGYLWYPNFEESNEDTVAVIGAWNTGFDARTYMIAAGNTDSNTSDYFNNFSYTSNLQQQGSIGGIPIFGDN